MRLRIFALLILSLPGFAQTGTPIISSDAFSCFSQLDGSDKASVSTVDVTGQSFTKAWHLNTKALSANPWEIRLRCFATRPAKKGDIGLATFWMRATDAPSDIGLAGFVVEQNASPYSKSVNATVAAGKDWKRFDLAFSFDQDYNANGYNLSFWINYQVQQIDLGGLVLTNYGQGFDVSSLNLPNYPYGGARADASWRAAAQARIEKYRKSDVVVAVRDAQGKPIAGATVRLQMKKHAFGFGTAVAGSWLSDSTSDGVKYRQTLLANFNKVVTENDLKWPFWETWAKNSSDFALNWFRDNRIDQVRGHNIIWPGKTNLPPDVVSMLNANPVNKDQLRTRINKHFDDVQAFAKGRVTEWDVVNEPYAEKDVQAVLGNAEMIAWYQRARVNDPNIKLYVNDYDTIEGGGYNLPHINGFASIVKGLIDGGAPVDGIGIQSHFATLTDMDRVVELLKFWGSFGKDTQVTEFDINITDEKLQADYTRDFVTAAFAEPSMKGFLMWGFWEGAHWLPNGAMFRKDWTPKRNAQVWRDLVYQTWWTDVSGTSASDGTFRTRGFLGDYDVTITLPDGTSKTTSLSLQPGDANFVTSGGAPLGNLAADAVVNAASFQSGPIAPGEIITLFGSGWGAPNLTLAYYNNNQLPTLAGDTRVLFDGVAAPMIYSANGQVSTIVPASVRGQTKIQIEYLGQRTPEAVVTVADAAPGLFACGANAKLPVIVNNSQGGKISCDAGFPGVKRGDVLTLFATGTGPVAPAVADGTLPTAPYPAPQLPVQVKFGSVTAAPCTASFAGLVYAGVMQINICVPSDAPTGDQIPLSLVAGSRQSLSLTIAVR